MKKIPLYDLKKIGSFIPVVGDGEALAGPMSAVQAIRTMIADEARENVVVLALNARRTITGAQVVSSGTLTQGLAHPREIFRMAIQLNAAAIIVGHNHPSGDPSPSPDDHALTRRLRESAEILGIPLVDHVIVGQDSFYSYAEHGWPR